MVKIRTCDVICKKCGADMYTKEGKKVLFNKSGLPILYYCKDCEYSEYVEYEYFI